MRIKGLSGVFANQIFPISGTLFIRRNNTSCNILFPDDCAGVSRMHCKVELGMNGVIVTDLGSSYGTFVNGIKLQSHVATTLVPGDTFYLGDQRNMFSLESDEGDVSYQQGGYADYAPAQTPLISTAGCVGYMLLFSIPIAGIIIAIVFSFGGTSNMQLRNFARAWCIIFLIALAIVVIWFLIVRFAILPSLYWGNPFGGLFGGFGW